MKIEANPQNENILAQFIESNIKSKQEKEKHFAEDLIEEVKVRRIVFK